MTHLLVALLVGLVGEALAEEELDPSLPFEPVEELKDHVAVSTRVTQPAITTPASVSVVTREQIATAGYRSVAEALSSVPGFYVSHDLVNYHVAVRGAFGGARAGSRLLKIMVDGVPIPFAQSETYLLGPEFLPMTAIERIEVLRGPASALYGAGAYAGAINIVTRQAPYEGTTTVGGELRGSYGTGATTGPGLDGAVSVTGRGSSLMVGGSGALEDRSGMTVPEASPFSGRFGGRESEDRATPASAFVRAIHGIGGGRLSIFGITQVQDRDAEFHDNSVLSNNTTVSLLNWKLAAAYERAFGEGFSSTLRAGVGGGRTTGRDRLQIPGEPFHYERELSYLSTSGAAELRYDFPNLAFVLAGVDGWFDQHELPQFFEVRDSVRRPANEARSVNLSNVAAYLQAVAPISDGVGVAAGARVDQHSVFGPQANARAALNFNHNDRIALKLIGGTSFKAASPEQLYTTPSPIPLEIAGDERLTPQRLYGGEMVLEGYPSQFVLLSASAFANEYRGVIGYTLEGADLSPTAYDAQNYGGEATFRMRKPVGEGSHVEGQLSVSLQQTLTEADPSSVFEDKAFPDNEGVPTAMTYARFGARIAPAKLQLTVEHRYIGDRNPSQANLIQNNSPLMSNPNYTLGDANLLDLTVSTTPLDVGDAIRARALVKVQNALDAQFLEVGFNGVDVPGLGRTVWLRLDAMF